MFEKELEAMILAAKKASGEIMTIYRKGFHVSVKEDDSPLTDADLASNRVIRSLLAPFSDTAWLSEEDADDKSRLTKRKLFVVDPLDGTSDFVARDDSFGINIALVYDRRPVVSVLAVPAKHQIVYASKGNGSYLLDEGKEPVRLHVSDRVDHLVWLTSKTHCSEEDKKIIERNRERIEKVVPLGASTKAVEIARGTADISIRYTDSTKEWDICASDLVVTEAGGIVVDVNGNPFVYNREDVYNRDGYCMFNRKENLKLL